VPEVDRAITHGRIAVDLEPIPLLGMTYIRYGGVVMLAPEERHRVEALPTPKNIARGNLALTFGDNPMLGADTLPGQPIRPTGDVARCKDALVCRSWLTTTP
jgi:hypothetical protein